MSPYQTLFYNQRWWILHEQRLLGGYAANELRSYLFPLYSPAGALVVQEAPADHPHHQGVCFGLEIDGQDLWNAGSFAKPRHPQVMTPILKELTPRVDAEGVTLAHRVAWRTVTGESLLHEERSVTFQSLGQATAVTWQSRLFHPDKAVHLGQTKEAGIGLRVPPHWESQFGGQIRDAQGNQGESACFDSAAPWLSIQGNGPTGTWAGVVLQPLTPPCPWFTRDYGVHIYNPLRHGAMDLSPGQELNLGLRILAYDGERTVSEINRML